MGNRQFNAPLTDTFSQFVLRGNMLKVEEKTLFARNVL